MLRSCCKRGGSDTPFETLQSSTAAPSISHKLACRRNSSVSPCRAKVCYWHLADQAAVGSNVRCRELSRHQTIETRHGKAAPLALRQRVSDNVISGRGSHEVMPAGHDDKILPAAELIDHRIGLAAGRQEILPQCRAGFAIGS